MRKRERAIEDTQDLDQVLGYLNFSSGASDPKFLASLNRLWRPAREKAGSEPIWRTVTADLQARLSRLAGVVPAFQDVESSDLRIAIAQRECRSWLFAIPRRLAFPSGRGRTRQFTVPWQDLRSDVETRWRRGPKSIA